MSPDTSGLMGDPDLGGIPEALEERPRPEPLQDPARPLDPMAWPAAQPMFTTKTIIDACIPWERRATFPHVARNTPELRARTLEKWGDQLDFLPGRRDRG